MVSSAHADTAMMVVPDHAPRMARPAAWAAIVFTVSAIVLLAALHVLSPEFAPSWHLEPKL